MNHIATREGIIWSVVGAIICLLSWKIHLGSFHEPGAGFVAFASGIALITIGVMMVLSKMFAKTPPANGANKHPLLLRLPKLPLVYMVMVLVGYGLVLDLLGYLITTFLVMFALFYDRGRNRLLPSVLASLLIVVSTYLIFETWLRIQLPRGIFPWW